MFFVFEGFIFRGDIFWIFRKKILSDIFLGSGKNSFAVVEMLKLSFDRHHDMTYAHSFLIL